MLNTIIGRLLLAATLILAAASAAAQTTPAPCPAWSADVVYLAGQCAVYQNQTFKAKWWTQGTAPSTTVAGAWELEAPPGPTGCVPWTASATFVEGQCATHEGVEYLAKWWTQGNVPSTDVAGPWQLKAVPNANGCVPWTAGASFETGQCATYQGIDFIAKWWTQGNVPSTTQAGPWEVKATPDANGCIPWTASAAFTAGQCATFEDKRYRANWWTQGNTPGSGTHGAWTLITTSTLTATLTAPTSDTRYTAPASITLRATASAAVQRIEFYAGTTLLGASTASPYRLVWSPVAAGTYDITAKAIGTDASATSTPVTITVHAPPQVVLIAPFDDATFAERSAIVLQAKATPAEGGAIAQVAFYQGDTLLGTRTSAPYILTWKDVPLGAYALSAVATDQQGITAASAPVAIQVLPNTAPTVSLSATPARSAAPATITLSAEALDTDGTVEKVEFYSGDTLLGTSTEPPYVYRWTGVAQGSYTVTARVTDNAGASASSAEAVVEVVKAGTVFFIHPDHLNTPRVITDETDAVVWRWDSDAFGSELADQDPGATGKAFVFNLRFPGQYFDGETGLHYNYFRDYDPDLGRYLQSDPIGLLAGPNTYTYVVGNPLAFVDPFGLVDINLNPKGSQEWRNAERIRSPADEISVAGHGNRHWIVDSEGKGVPADNLIDLIKKHPKYSTAKRVRIISCDVGNGSYPKDVAEGTGLPTIAPDNKVWTYSDGRPPIVAEPRKNQPNLNRPGNWVTSTPTGN